MLLTGLTFCLNIFRRGLIYMTCLLNSTQSSHNASLLQTIIRSLRGTVLDSTEQTIFKLSCVEKRKPNIHDGVGKLTPTLSLLHGYDDIFQRKYLYLRRR